MGQELSNLVAELEAQIVEAKALGFSTDVLEEALSGFKARAADPAWAADAEVALQQVNVDRSE